MTELTQSYSFDPIALIIGLVLTSVYSVIAHQLNKLLKVKELGFQRYTIFMFIFVLLWGFFLNGAHESMNSGFGAGLGIFFALVALFIANIPIFIFDVINILYRWSKKK